MKPPLQLPGFRGTHRRCAAAFLASLVSLRLFAAVPVITSPASQDVYYTPQQASSLMFSYLITASNSPTSFDAAPLPPGYTVNRTTGVILGDPQRPGVFTLNLSAANADGAATATCALRIHPAVIGVLPTPGTYATGERIQYRLQCNAPVTVSGTPALVTSGGRALYASGSGTDTLTFHQVVAPTDGAAGEVTVTGLEMNGGSIKEANGLDLGLALPLRHLATGVRITSAPAPVTPVVVTSGNASGIAGQPFTYTVLASGAPTAFTAQGLPAGLAVSNAGVISGTPAAAGNYPVTLQASNATGGSGSGTVVLTITAATTPTPPPPPPVPPPPVPVAQTVALAVRGEVVVERPVTLAASASSGLPVVLSIVSGNASLNGTELTVRDTGNVIVRGTQAGGSGYAPATAEITVSAARAAQSVEFVSPVSSIVIGQPVLLSATASSGLPVTFTVVRGEATISGNALVVNGPGPVVVRATQSGSAGLSPASAEVTITGALRVAQTLSLPASAEGLRSDRPLTLTATASSGLPVSFEVVNGPATLQGNTLVPTAASGTVTLRITQPGNAQFAPVETTRSLAIATAGRLVNLSARVAVREGDASRAFIAGFVVAGDAPKRMLVRAVGPGLAGFGVQGPLGDPELRIHDRDGRVVAENNDWGSDAAAAFARLGAFALAAGSRDAALLVTLPPGPYTLQVLARSGQGVALVEIYDASDAPALERQQVINLSTRAHVDTGEGVLTTGFVVTGEVPKRVLVRGVGPALAAFGIGNVLSDPVLRVHQGSTVIAQNDDWETAQATSPTQPVASPQELAAAASEAGAFALAGGSRDAAVIVTLQPGAYTAVVSGANGGTGAGLVEVYELPADR